MKKITTLIFVGLFLMLVGHVAAQSYDNLWITGTAVPGGKQQLTKFPNNLFKFAGTLQPGELKIMDTEEAAADTKYIVPRYPDSYIVNNGLPFTVGTDVNGTKAGWVVTLAEDRYRFTVDMTNRTLKGELFDAWDELFLVGGAASCGWESYIMLPFTRVEGERCTYTWTGELKNRTENVEPRRFKLTGQNAWEPKHLHPFTQDESPLTTTQLRTGGDDTKWQIAADGWYRITVDVFRETFHADYLGRTPTEGQATGISLTSSPKGEGSKYVYDLQGRKVASLMNSEERTMNNSLFTNHYSSGQRPNPGIYIIGGKKVVIK